MSIATAVALALSPLVSEQQQAAFDISKQPDLCVVDPATVVPVDPGEGTTTTYIIEVKVFTKEIEAFLATLDRERFGVYTVLTPNFSLMFVATRKIARNADQIRDEVAQLCKLSDITPMRLALSNSRDGKRRAKEERLRLRAVARATAEAQRRHQEFLRSHPSIEELNVLLPKVWDESDTLSGISGMTFNRVREVRCKRRRGDFACNVGLLLLFNGNPEYEVLDVTFRRDKEGKLAISEPGLIVVN